MPASLLSFSFGKAAVRAAYLTTDQLHQASCVKVDDYAQTLTYLSKHLEKQTGGKLDPSEVYIIGSATDLEKLGEVSATLVTEEEAIRAAEKYLSSLLHHPTAILDIGASAFLDHFPAETVARWLPFIVNLNDIENYLANKRLFPRTIPPTNHEYEIDLAQVRQSIIKLGERDDKDYLEIPEFLNLVVTGGVASHLSPRDLVNLILDSTFLPAGGRIYLDQASLVALLGPMTSETEFNYQYQELTELGILLHLRGDGRREIVISGAEKRNLSVGQNEVVAVTGLAEQVELQVREDKKTLRFQFSTNSGQLFLDNRSRPLPISAGSKESIAKITSWRQSLEVA